MIQKIEILKSSISNINIQITNLDKRYEDKCDRLKSKDKNYCYNSGDPEKLNLIDNYSKSKQKLLNEKNDFEKQLNELETGSEDQQEQPDKIVLKRGRKKDTDLEKRIIVLDRLETALKLKEKGHKLYLQENYHSTLTRDFKYFYEHISKAKDKLSKLKIEDIEKAKPKK